MRFYRIMIAVVLLSCFSTVHCRSENPMIESSMPGSSAAPETEASTAVEPSGEAESTAFPTPQDPAEPPAFAFPWSRKGVPSSELGIYADYYRYISLVSSSQPNIDLIADSERFSSFVKQLQEEDLSFSKSFVETMDIIELPRSTRFPEGTMHIILAGEDFLTCVYIEPSGRVVVIEMLESAEEPKKHEKYDTIEGAVDPNDYSWILSNDSDKPVYRRAHLGPGYVSILLETNGS